MQLCWCTLIHLCVTLGTVICKEHFCEQNAEMLISGEITGIIKTRLTGESYYGKNMNCKWHIDAGANHRIKLTIQQLNMEWVPTYTTCNTYDNLMIIEGDSTLGELITFICHGRNPYFMISQGHDIYLWFTTNHYNAYNYIGVDLRFDVFEENICPPGWFSESRTSEDCFTVTNSIFLDWPSAQDHCLYSRANLASILTSSEYIMIKENGRNLPVSQAWIGLNDLSNEGSLVWIDTSPVTFTQNLGGGQGDFDCVRMDFDKNSWEFRSCGANTANIVCKAKRDGSTVLYSVPWTHFSDNDIPNLNVSLALGLGVSLTLAVIIAIIAGLCIHRHMGNRRVAQQTKNQQDETRTTHSMNNPGGRHNPRSRPQQRSRGNGELGSYEVNDYLQMPSSPSEFTVNFTLPSYSNSQGEAPPTYEEALSYSRYEHN